MPKVNPMRGLSQETCKRNNCTMTSTNVILSHRGVKFFLLNFQLTFSMSSEACVDDFPKRHIVVMSVGCIDQIFEILC